MNLQRTLKALGGIGGVSVALIFKIHAPVGGSELCQNNKTNIIKYKQVTI